MDSCSPDGRRIVFSTARSGEEMRIWIASASGGNLRQDHPSVRPLARVTALVTGRQKHRVRLLATDERWHIWTVDADGGAPHQLTNGAGELVPTWSPDSTHVYYWAWWTMSTGPSGA